MDQSKVRLVNLPPTLRHANRVGKDGPINARVEDNVAAKIVSWTKEPSTVTDLMP